MLDITMANDELNAINAELKKQLRSLVISCPKGLTLQRLLKDYQELIGQVVPFRKLGFMTFEDYLLSIHDTCRLQGTGKNTLVIPVITEKNKHINEMILKQRPPKSNSRYTIPRRSKGVYNCKFDERLHFKRSQKQNISDYNLHNKSEINTGAVPKDFNLCDNRINRKILLPTPLQHITDSIRNQKLQNYTGTKPKQKNYNSCDNKCENLTLSTSRNYSLENMNNQIKQPEKFINTNFKKQIYNLRDRSCMKKKHCENNIIQSPNSNIQTNNANDHDHDSNCYVVYNEKGSNSDSLNGLYCSDDDLFSYDTEEEELTFCMKDMINCKSSRTDSSTVRESRVNSIVKEKLKILISEHPDGIWCSKLLRIYEQKYNQKLDPLNFGFVSVIQMCDDLPDIFHCVRPNRMDWKVYDKRKPIPDVYSMRNFSKYLETLPINHENKKNTEPALPIDFVFTPAKFVYPENVMHPGQNIPRQWLQDDMNLKDYFEVLVSEVYDPSKFWIHFKGPDTTEALIRLMDNMQVYYMHHAEALKLNDFSVSIGLFCAALFMNEYHRAVVIKVFNDETIKVFYVDYGTVAQVAVSKTCFLHTDFSVLPMQAVRARLANIIPVDKNTMWPREASKLMLDMIMEKDLMAYIVSIDHAQQILELIITDTTTDVDIHINDTLIEKGYAVLGNKVQSRNFSNAILPNIHLFPAFEELENGIYPSISEVIIMLKLGHTYETIFPGYFSTEIKSSFSPDQYLEHSNVISRVKQTFSTYSEENIEINEPLQFQTIDCEKREYSQISANKPEDFIVSELDFQTKSQIDNLRTEFENGSFETETIDSKGSEDKKILESQLDRNVTNNCTYKEPKIESQNITRPPPGFENVSTSNNQYSNLYKEEIASFFTNPDYLTGYSLIQHPLKTLQNVYNSIHSTYLTNPVLYHQLLNEKQWEPFGQMQQNQLPNQIHKLNEIVLHRQNMVFGNQSGNNNSSYASYKNNEISNFTSDSSSAVSIGKKAQIEKLDENTCSIINVNEHICDKYVMKIDIQDYFIHVLKINDEFYVVSQEIISNLLKEKLTWKQWLKLENIDSSNFPNKLINIMNYADVYREIQKYLIPGVNPPNNLGCNVRVTPIIDVPDIVEKFGNKNIIPDLKKIITDIIYKSNAWKAFNSSD